MRSALALVFVTLGLCCDQAPRVAAPEAAVDTDGRGELLELVARGYYPGRSGQILFIPEPGEVMLRRPMEFYRFMHGSPWEYDRRIPFIFYGPGFVNAAEHADRVGQQDIAPTMLWLVGAEAPATMSGRALEFIARDHEASPRVAVVMVLDGMRADYLERYGDVMPTIVRMVREGASFDNAWIDYVPTVTSAGHTTIGTGADPRIHGIAGNGFYDAALGRERTLFEGRSPENVMAPALADLWSLHTGGEAVIVAQGTTPRATVSLAGHGACFPNGRPVVMAMFDYGEAVWVTNEDCYRLPGYLASANARTFWEQKGARWGDRTIDDGRVFVMTPLLPEFQVDGLISMIEGESVGKDDVPDLVMVNFKSPDYVGHNFGPDADETKEVLEALDIAIGRAIEAIESAAGERGYVIAVSADHGMPPEPDGTDSERRFIREMMAEIHEQLDPEGRLLYPFMDTANNQLYVNHTRMLELDLEVSAIARVVEALPYVRVAFAESEVRAAARRLD